LTKQTLKARILVFRANFVNPNWFTAQDGQHNSASQVLMSVEMYQGRHPSLHSHFRVSAIYSMATTNGLATSNFPGRYYHIDQILDKPGPRTDPSFAAGEEVGALRCDF
jgi:hypothetical protein